MSATIISLTARRDRRERSSDLEWDNTDRGRAVQFLSLAVASIVRDDIPSAFRDARRAHEILERLDGGVTLAEDFAQLNRRLRRMAAGRKGAETRARNRALAQTRDGGQ